MQGAEQAERMVAELEKKDLMVSSLQVRLSSTLRDHLASADVCVWFEMLLLAAVYRRVLRLLSTAAGTA